MKTKQFRNIALGILAIAIAGYIIFYTIELQEQSKYNKLLREKAIEAINN